MTQDPVEDLFSLQVPVPVDPALSVAVAVHPDHLNCQVSLLSLVVVPLISRKVVLISHPDKTLQEDPPLQYPTHPDHPRASHLVGVPLHHHSLEDQGPVTQVPPCHPVFHQGGTDLSLPLPHQEAPPAGLDRTSLRPLLHHLQTAADLPYLQLQEGGLHFLTTDRRHHHQLLEEVTDRRCPATCPLLPRLSTPNLLPRLPQRVVPQLVGGCPLCRQDDRDLLLSRLAREEGRTKTHPAYPRGTAHSTATLQHPLLVDQDPSLLLQMRDRHLLEETSHRHAQVLFLHRLLQVATWAEAASEGPLQPPPSAGRARSLLVAGLVVDLLCHQTGRALGGVYHLHHRLGMVSKTRTTTKCKMTLSTGSLFTRCRTFLHLIPTCPPRKPTPVRSPRRRAKVLVKKSEELLPFLLYPGEEKMAAITTLGPTTSSSLLVSFSFSVTLIVL